MRPYLAVVKDSFREALRSPVLWVFVGLLTLLLAGIAPLGAREQLNAKLDAEDVSSWPEFGRRLSEAGQAIVPSPGKRIWNKMDEKVREKIGRPEFREPKPGATLPEITAFVETLKGFIEELNKAIESQDLYDKVTWTNVKLSKEAQELLDKGSDLDSSERQRFHRLAVEAAFPDLIRARPRTSFIFSYAGQEWSPVPLDKKQFHDFLGSTVAYLSDWIVGLGLIMAATLLTAPIIPRMFDQGQLHLLLSKPISRTLLLLFQFFGGCAYVLVLTSSTLR